MGKSRRHVTAALCVLLLNLQLFAVNALGCVHQGDMQMQMIGCPHAHGGMLAGDPPLPDADQSTDGSCQKCSLDSVAAGWHLFAPEPPIVAASADTASHAVAHSPLHSRSPDGLLRPPQRSSV